MITSCCFMWLSLMFTAQCHRVARNSQSLSDGAKSANYQRPLSDNASQDISHEIDEAKLLTFPKGFVMGVATASYQIEGAWNVSGKGVSVWDHFVHVDSSRVLNGDNGDVACNSYNKYKEDVAILKKLGVDVYRFSVSWTRILPTGFVNEISEDGLAYYKRLLEELLANDIEPIVTMLHWDHPQTIEDLGGWTNELMVDWFADYARVLFRELGPKVKKWITLNEPEENCVTGYSHGTHAPGKKIHGIGEYLCGHNVLKAHARVYRMYQEEFKSAQNGIVGITLNLAYYYPKNPEKDQSAVERALNISSWLLHPIFSNTGDYHEALKDIVAQNSLAEDYPRSRLPEFSESWIKFIKGSADFLGLNHYTSWQVERGDQGLEPSLSRDRGVIRSVDPSWDRGASVWLNVVPRGLGDLLRRLASEYKNPDIYITENGFSDHGETNDSARIRFHHDYMKEMLIAINRDGVNVKGYLLWSLLDNFEWSRGYSEKFGLVKVDYNDPARKRTLKDSAYWWQRLLQRRSLGPDNVNHEHA